MIIPDSITRVYGAIAASMPSTKAVKESTQKAASSAFTALSNAFASAKSYNLPSRAYTFMAQVGSALSTLWELAIANIKRFVEQK